MSKRDLFAPFRAAYKADAEKNNGPKYWRSVEHKTSDPVVMETMDQEFPSGTGPLPEMQRREVLKLAGASIASSTEDANAAMALSDAVRRRIGVARSGALDDSAWAGAAHC